MRLIPLTLAHCLFPGSSVCMINFHSTYFQGTENISLRKEKKIVRANHIIFGIVLRFKDLLSPIYLLKRNKNKFGTSTEDCPLDVTWTDYEAPKGLANYPACTGHHLYTCHSLAMGWHLGQSARLDRKN